VLDYGLWGRDERSALRWLARSAGAACQVVYLPVDKDVQLARIAYRQATAPHQTFPMSEADVDQWRGPATSRSAVRSPRPRRPRGPRLPRRRAR
jgi:predicted kinase